MAVVVVGRVVFVVVVVAEVVVVEAEVGSVVVLLVGWLDSIAAAFEGDIADIVLEAEQAFPRTLPAIGSC